MIGSNTTAAASAATVAPAISPSSHIDVGIRAPRARSISPIAA
jgi:hypothetical protein